MTPRQLVLRVLVVLLPQLTLVAEVAAGAGWSWWVSVTLAVAATLAALRPDTQAGLFVVLLAGAHWVVVGSDTTPWVLLVAGALTAFHLLLMLAALGPAYVDLPAPLLRLWARRALLAAAAAVLTWAAVVVVVGAHPAVGIVSFGAGLAVVAVGLVLVARTTRMDQW